MAADAMIHFHYGGQGALAEAGDGAHGELLVGRGEQNLVRLAVRAFIGHTQTQFQTNALQKIA